jgi:hypothetical protein
MGRFNTSVLDRSSHAARARRIEWILEVGEKTRARIFDDYLRIAKGAYPEMTESTLKSYAVSALRIKQQTKTAT